MQSLMSNSKQSEQDAAANWKSLQAELGLISDESEAKPAGRAPQQAAGKTTDQPPSMWGTTPPAGQPLPKESPFIEGSIPVPADVGEPQEAVVTDEPEAAAPGSEHEVEVGEAPEEITEPEAETEEEDKRPSRRRRGRRRQRSDGDRRDETEAPETSAEPSAESDEGAEDEEDEEAEAVPFADWNVPSWQELIGSLYRPER